MSLAEVGRPGQRVDVVHGGDVTPEGRLLSVAEIQQALRELRARKATVSGGVPTARVDTPQKAAVAVAPPREVGDAVCSGAGIGDEDAAWDHVGGAKVGDLAAGWVGILAAHSGAGASTVALALSDAAAATGRRVHLVETARLSRCGLVAAAAAELGSDPTGTWRRGLRGQVTIDRLAVDTSAAGWPAPLETGAPIVTVIDLGLASPAVLKLLAASRARTVVVCRPTVPGVRAAEQLLARLTAGPLVVAAVGAGKWPGEVIASTGPLLRGLRARNRVVGVPLDRHLEVSGPTTTPLPRSVAMAGRAVLELIDAVDSNAVTSTWGSSALVAVKGAKR